MGKRTEDGGRARVIAAARGFFVQKGFHQTGMAELACRSEVSVGQIYRLFASKSDIIAAIVREDMSRRFDVLTSLCQRVSAGELTPRDAFAELAVGSISAGHDVLTFEILAEGLRDPRVGTVIGDLCEHSRRLMRQIILAERPALEGDRLIAAEEMLLAIVFALDNNTIFRPRLNARDTASHAADMIVAMLHRSD